MQNIVLANVVSAYAVCLAGLVSILFVFIRRQPKRWIAVYLGILLTGLATVWYHADEAVIPARLADISTNWLLAWLVQLAVLGDFYSLRSKRIIAAITGTIILATFAWHVSMGPAARVFPVSFGPFGGYTVGELCLIGNVFVAVGLIAYRRARIPPEARPQLALLLVWFTIGLLLSTASNDRVDFGILPYHAAWHVVAGFGFIIFWAMNDARFQISST